MLFESHRESLHFPQLVHIAARPSELSAPWKRKEEEGEEKKRKKKGEKQGNLVREAATVEKM